jgi:hypothetical protein
MNQRIVMRRGSHEQLNDFLSNFIQFNLLSQFKTFLIDFRIPFPEYLLLVELGLVDYQEQEIIRFVEIKQQLSRDL